MLGAFFGPEYLDWWLPYAMDPSRMQKERSHWLLRASAARAFAKGLVRLERLQPSMIEFKVTPVLFHANDPNPIEVDGVYVLLGDHSRSGVLSVDARFIGSQGRFSRGIRYLELAKQIAPDILQLSSSPSTVINQPTWHPTSATSKPRSFSLTAVPTRVFLSVWLMFPNRVRTLSYDILRGIGERLYGKPRDSSTQRLPFGLFLKLRSGPLGVRNELNALQTVRQHSSVPVPKPLDSVVKKMDWSHKQAYLLMTTLPGMPLADCEQLLADRDFSYIAAQLRDYLAQLRAIPRCTPATSSEMAVCDTLGEACVDRRIRGGLPVGPFPDEAAFSTLLRLSDDPARRNHKIVFIHADLNPRNILVDRMIHPDGSAGWQVTGIVDWETAGYFPEYWDYTKSLFKGTGWARRYVNMVKESLHR